MAAARSTKPKKKKPPILDLRQKTILDLFIKKKLVHDINVGTALDLVYDEYTTFIKKEMDWKSVDATTIPKVKFYPALEALYENQGVDIEKRMSAKLTIMNIGLKSDKIEKEG